MNGYKIPYGKVDITIFDTEYSLNVTDDLINGLNISGSMDLNIRLDDRWKEIIESVNKLYNTTYSTDRDYQKVLSKLSSKIVIKTKVFDVFTNGMVSSVNPIDDELVKFEISLDRNMMLVKSSEVRDTPLCVSIINPLADVDEFKFNHFRYGGNIVNFELCGKDWK